MRKELEYIRRSLIWNWQRPSYITDYPGDGRPNLFSYKSIIDLGIGSLLSWADSCLYSTFSVDYIMMCVHSIYYLYRNSARKDLQLLKALDWLIPLSFAVVLLPCESHHLKSFSLKSHLFRLIKWLYDKCYDSDIVFYSSYLSSLDCSYAHKCTNTSWYTFWFYVFSSHFWFILGYL